MENLSTYNIRVAFFIKVFFGLLAGGFLLIAIICASFDVNDSVSFQRGEIMPEIPQQDFNAPFEAIPEQIFVTEGQKVQAGDTLLVLGSKQVRKDYEEAQSNYEAALKTNEAVSQIIPITKDKIENVRRERELNAESHRDQKEKLTRELKSAAQQAELNREKLDNVGLARLNMDSTLFKDQLISRLDMANSYERYLDYRQTLLESENARDQIQSDLENLENEYRKTQNLLDLKLIELREKLEELKKEQAVSERELARASENLEYWREEAQKQYVVAELDGEVMNMFNLKYAQNYVNKGDHLLSVVPDRDNFYARVMIPQRDMRYIEAGQEAHLKLDAYNVYENGILRGTVSYVPERKPREDFFVILTLSPDPDFNLKAGYAVKGEVIVERLKLYRYIAKKLFRKFESSPAAASNTAGSPDQNS